MQAVVDEEPPAPRYAGPALGPVIEAFLRKDPATRPSAAEAEQMLAEAAEGRRPRTAQAYVPTRHVDLADGTAGGSPADGDRTDDDTTGTDRPGAAGTASGGGPQGAAAAHAPTAADAATAVTDTSGGPAAGHPAANGYASGPGPADGHAATPVPGRATVGTHISGASGWPGAPGHPATPPFGATAHQPYPASAGGTGAAGRPRRRGRTVALVLAFAVVVGGGGALAYTQLGNDGTAGRRSDTSPTDAATVSSPSPSDSSASSAASGADGAVPEGWQRLDDPLGFSVVVPQGWKRKVTGSQIDYTPDGGEHFLRIAVDDSPDFDTAYGHLADLEQQLKRLKNYQRVSLASNIYRDCQGALWDFTWDAVPKDGPFPGPRRAIEQSYISRDGVEYALYLSSPAADWDTARKQFDTVLRGWRPPAQS
jgi:hypothetical protein